MELEPDDQQAALRDELARFLTDRVTSEARWAAAAKPGAVDRPLWRELGGMGAFSLALAEADGGVGLGWADAVLVAEELGRFAVPGPIVATTLAATLAPGLVPGAAAGEAVVGVVDDAAPALVEHLAGLDRLVVLEPGQVRLLDGPAVAALAGRATPLARPLDPLTPVHRVTRPEGGDVVGDEAAARAWRLAGGLLVAALQVGLGDGAVRMATAYAGQRRQFDREIGSFQAVKHLLADAHTGIEVARSAVWSAAVELDEASGPLGAAEAGPGEPTGHEPERAVAAARVVAGHASLQAGKTCIQVHGGMGYTWELDAHLFLKRAMVLDTALGGAESALDAMASFI